MSGLDRVDAYPEIPVSLGPSRDALKTGVWRSERPVRVDRIAPCVVGCPAGVPIPRFFHHLANGDLNAALTVFSLRNPFPALTGRLCPHQCEHDCNRRTSGAALSIRTVERFLGDAGAAVPHPLPEQESGRRVAVVGSGARGLSAAYYLRRSGHDVVVHERSFAPGGLLRFAVPGYRLAPAVLDNEIRRLRDMGIAFVTGRAVQPGDLAGYDAVCDARSTIAEIRPDVPGADLLRSGLQFLSGAHDGAGLPGRKAAVIGAGDTGVDTARVLLRLGVEVTVIHAGTTRDIPAIRESYLRALKEGITFLTRTRLVSVAAAGSGLDLIVESGEERRTEHVDAAYVGAERYEGPGSVVDAITAGRLAADEINARIGGGYPVPDWLERESPGDVVEVEEVNPVYVPSGPRVRQSFRDSAPGFDEESMTIDVEEARAEIERCLSCGFCNDCGTCFVFCPDAAVTWSADGPLFEYEHCKGCGICVAECPGHTIVLVPEQEAARA